MNNSNCYAIDLAAGQNIRGRSKVDGMTLENEMRKERGERRNE